jgi:hypothetical protein
VVIAALLNVEFPDLGWLEPGGLDAWWRRRDRPDLCERLRPYCQRSVADEAQRWLHGL